MEQQSKNFLSLIRSYLTGTKASLSHPDWESILTLSRLHNIVPLVYESARLLPDFASAPLLVQNAFLENTLYQAGLQISKTQEFLRLYDIFSGEELHALVLKGLVCRTLYPQPELRGSSDEDLWISREEFPSFHKLLVREGYVPCQPVTDDDRFQELTYSSPLLEIDLHLNPFGTSRVSRQKMEQIFSDSSNASIPMEIEGHIIYTLSPTEHYLFLFVHLYKHFLEGGVGIRQLLDLFLFEQAFSGQLDWKRIHTAIFQLEADVLYTSILALGQEHLGFSLHPFPSTSPMPDSETLDALMEDLLESGCFGNSARYQQLSGTYAYAASTGKRSLGRTLLRVFFPPVKRLRDRYPFLRRSPWLLPAAWLIRIFRFTRESILADKHLIAKSTRRGRKRLQLMKQLQLKKDA